MTSIFSPLLLAALDHLPAGMWICEPDGRLAYFNRRAAEVWGREPLLHDPRARFNGALRLFRPDGTEVPLDESWTARCTRDGRDFLDRDLVIGQPDGNRVSQRVSARRVFAADGALLGTVTVMIDPDPTSGLDEEERERMHRASRHLAAIVESSDDAIIGKDLNSVITSWNAASERLFGYTAEEIIGRPVTVLMPPELLREEPVIIGRVRRGERVDHFETVRLRRDGSRVEVSLTVSPIRGPDGRIVGASKIVRDITARKQAERALKETREQLEAAKGELEQRVRERTSSLSEAIAQLEEFSYTVSHDLRAPLRGMQIYSRALREDFGQALAAIPEAAHYVDRIEDNANRLDRMILDVLTFSRVARAEMTMTPVALDALVREIAGQYPSMSPPNAVVEISRLDAVVGHVPSLTQALSNLLTNAVKFVPPGRVPHVRVWTSRAQGRVRIFVADNGIGIPVELHHRLFRMFERVHGAGAYEGSGVGLAIVKKAVERMNGTFGVESGGAGGATFWLDLPAAEMVA